MHNSHVVLIIADDAGFARDLLARWQLERIVPGFTVMSTELFNGAAKGTSHAPRRLEAGELNAGTWHRGSAQNSASGRGPGQRLVNVEDIVLLAHGHPLHEEGLSRTIVPLRAAVPDGRSCRS